MASKGNSNAKGKAKTRGDVAPKVRFIVDKAIQKLGMQACIDMLAEEIQANGFSNTIPKLSQYFPKEMDITTTNLTPEQWLEAMSDASKPEGHGPEDTVQGQLH